MALITGFVRPGGGEIKVHFAGETPIPGELSTLAATTETTPDRRSLVFTGCQYYDVLEILEKSGMAFQDDAVVAAICIGMGAPRVRAKITGVVDNFTVSFSQACPTCEFLVELGGMREPSGLCYSFENSDQYDAVLSHLTSSGLALENQVDFPDPLGTMQDVFSGDESLYQNFRES
jgi:hypothetical protein